MNQNMQMQTDDILRRAIRENDIVQTAQIMDCVPALLDSVTIDRERLVREVRERLSEHRGNPVAALLEMIGLRLVRRERAVKCLEDALTASDGEQIPDGEEIQLESVEPDGQRWVLKVDEARLEQAAASFAKALAEYEQAQRRITRQAQEYRSDTGGQINALREEILQARQECDDMRRAAAQGLQRLLCQAGSEDGLRGAIEGILEDMDMSAQWPSEAGSEVSAFTTLKCEDPEARKDKPCIIHDGRVLVKGLRYVQA